MGYHSCSTSGALRLRQNLQPVNRGGLRAPSLPSLPHARRGRADGIFGYASYEGQAAVEDERAMPSTAIGTSAAELRQGAIKPQ
jgi:hypothetical protein